MGLTRPRTPCCLHLAHLDHMIARHVSNRWNFEGAEEEDEETEESPKDIVDVVKQSDGRIVMVSRAKDF